MAMTKQDILDCFDNYSAIKERACKIIEDTSSCSICITDIDIDINIDGISVEYYEDIYGEKDILIKEIKFDDLVD